VASQSHLGGSVGVAPAGGAEAVIVGGTDWLICGLVCVAVGPEVGAGVAELA
jgi:hypothetical protein